MNTNYFWISIIAIIFYLILTDLSVLKFLNLMIRFIDIELYKFKWWIWYNPRTPWAKFIMWNNSKKLARELMNENEHNS